MMKLISLFALFAVANAQPSPPMEPTLAKSGLRGKLPAGMPPSAGTTTCTAVCTKSATDSDFVKKYIAQAEEAAKTLQGKLAEQDEAKTKQGEATNTATGADKAALKSKESYDKSGFSLFGHGFFKKDETLMNLNQAALNVANGARDSAKGARVSAKTATADAEAGIATANQKIRDATNSVIDSCVLACDAARAAAKKVFVEHPNNKLGVSAGLSIAAAGNEPEPKNMMNGKDYGSGFGNV